MYKPVPPRPKKTNIVRSRNGCRTCRERRVKCDEKKPVCGTCVRLGKICTFIRPEFKFHNVVLPGFQSTVTRVQEPENSKDTQCQSETQEKDRTATVSLGSLDLVRSLQHVERDVWYYTYWEDRCLPVLQPIFFSISRLANNHSMLRQSVLALSSCHFSRQEVERKTSSTSNMGNFRPSLSHQTRSHLYYSSAIQEMAHISSQTLLEDATIIMAVLTLFAYIESSVGNFQGFRCHVKGMSQLLENHTQILKSPVNKALIIAWMQIRFVNWWSRAYFSSRDVHRRLPPVSLPQPLQGSHDLLYNSRVAVLSILCESHRLNFCEALRYAELDQNVSMLEHAPVLMPDSSSEACFRLLEEQKCRLDDWLLSLPPCDLPILDQNNTWDSGDLGMPLCFQSYNAAVNFAYYALCRVMQCTGLLRSLQCCNFPYVIQCEEEAKWVRVLLRIIKGTDIRASVHKNNYAIGFQGLLLAALLRCRCPTLGIEIQNWVQNLAHLQPTEEGSFPVYQTLGVIKAINCQKQTGIHVFGVTQPVDDDGGTPKVTAFNSQPIDRLIFHGRHEITGSIVAKCVFIDF